jgi:alpha-ketoglutarate-dependent taurine dioxygenase
MFVRLWFFLFLSFGLATAWLSKTTLRHGFTYDRRFSLKMVATDEIETVTQNLNPSITQAKVRSAKVVNQGKLVEIEFVDGSAFAFHALWLRDACRDDAHVVACAGERQLTATAAMISSPHSILAKSLLVSADGDLQVKWDGDETRIGGVENSITESVFRGNFLRSYAEIVGKPLDSATMKESLLQDDFEWLRPYTGYPDAKAPRRDTVNYWKNSDIQAGKFEISTFKYEDANESNLDFLKALMRDGVVLVDGVPECSDATVLKDFTYRVLGGLQKDPARDEPNWKITKKEGATSVSYAHDKRLINHTDQSVPPHGIPGLVLIMHYLVGKGANTLADGFAAAERLRSEDPEAFKLLSKYGYDAERDFIASRVDSGQEHNKSLLVSRKHPIFTLDDNGDLVRIVYNEVFRTPLTLPFDIFTPWYAAFNKFVTLIHSEEFETTVEMSAGRFLIMHNWRVMHGRAGNRASSTRTVVGGTVTREGFFSRATQLMQTRDEILGSQF